MFRYKRLNFGISCAPEMYNKIIQQVFEGCKGVKSIYADVVVYGATEKEDNDNLEQVHVLQILRERGLTLNQDKCMFNMKQIEFMGHVLSAKGIGLSQSKVQVIFDARTPQSVSEVKSFMGLVNFMGRFIPNLATLMEPLNRLTRKDTKFKWKTEQEESFQQLKWEMARATNLAYFNAKATMQVIAL